MCNIKDKGYVYKMETCLYFETYEKLQRKNVRFIYLNTHTKRI